MSWEKSNSNILRCFIDRDVYSLDWKVFWTENKVLLLATFVVFTITVLFRSWPNYVNPGLYVEDTSHYFNYFYGNNRNYTALLHAPNGYHNILNNFIGLYIAKIDVRYQPYLYAWVGTTFAILASMALSCSGIFKNTYIIFIAPFLLGLSGLNHIFYYITLTYQIYVLVILLLCLLFFESVKNNLKNFTLFLFLSLLIWSGPYSVLVVPFSFCFILFFKGKTRLLLGLSAVSLLYTASVSKSTIMLEHIFNPDVWYIWRHTFIHDVCLMQLSGKYENIHLYIVLTSLFLFYFLLRKDFFYIKVACIVIVLINSAIFALLLSKKIELYLTILPCYLVIAQFLWLFLLLFTCDRLLIKNKKYHHCGALVVLCCIGFIVFDNYKVPAKHSIPVMTSLPTFLDRVYEAENKDLEQQNIRRVIVLGNDHFQPVAKVGATGPAAKEELERIE